MKKVILILLIILPIQASAGGTYDGIWQITSSIFATVNQNGDALAVVVLQDQVWEAQLGTISGNQATVSTVYGWVSLNATITFTSLNTATIRINSCSDGQYYTCLFQPGTILPATKIF